MSRRQFVIVILVLILGLILNRCESFQVARDSLWKITRSYTNLGDDKSITSHQFSLILNLNSFYNSKEIFDAQMGNYIRILKHCIMKNEQHILTRGFSLSS